MESLVLLISLLPIALLAENQVTNAELSKKLDLINDEMLSAVFIRSSGCW